MASGQGDGNITQESRGYIKTGLGGLKTELIMGNSTGATIEVGDSTGTVEFKGDVGIGKTPATDFKLDVNGKIKTLGAETAWLSARTWYDPDGRAANSGGLTWGNPDSMGVPSTGLSTGGTITATKFIGALDYSNLVGAPAQTSSPWKDGYGGASLIGGGGGLIGGNIGIIVNPDVGGGGGRTFDAGNAIYYDDGFVGVGIDPVYALHLRDDGIQNSTPIIEDLFCIQNTGSGSGAPNAAAGSSIVFRTQWGTSGLTEFDGAKIQYCDRGEYGTRLSFKTRTHASSLEDTAFIDKLDIENQGGITVLSHMGATGAVNDNDVYHRKGVHIYWRERTNGEYDNGIISTTFRGTGDGTRTSVHSDPANVINTRGLVLDAASVKMVNPQPGVVMMDVSYNVLVPWTESQPDNHVADCIINIGTADGYGTRFNIIYFGNNYENATGGASITEGRMDLGMGTKGYPEGSGGPFNFLSLQTRNRKYATDTNVITMKNNGTVEAYQDMSYYFKIGNSSSRSGALGGSGLWVSSVGAFNALYSRCGTTADNGGNNWMNKTDPFPFKIVMGTNESAFTMNTSGNVGIGKDPTSYFLDVNGSIASRGFIDVFGRNASGANKNDDKYCMMYITGLGGDAKDDFVIDASQTGNGISIRTGIGTTTARFDKDGRLGIGTDKPGQQFEREKGNSKALLHVNGGYLLLSNEDNDSGTAHNRGGCISFESGDNSTTQGEHALIAVHAYDKDSTGTGNKDRNEMLFYMGNNDDGGYGPDMFTFVGSRFNVFAGSSPVSIEHPGDDVYGIDAARVISGRAWGNPTTNSDQVPQFIVDSFGISVSGEGRFTGNVTAYYSDERLKDFKGKITNPIEKIKQLNGYYFVENALAKSFGYDNDRLQVGVSAQEVEKVLPEIVTQAPLMKERQKEEGYKTIWYEKLTPLLIEGIKSQQQQIESQQQQINELKEMMKALLAKK